MLNAGRRAAPALGSRMWRSFHGNFEHRREAAREDLLRLHGSHHLQRAWLAGFSSNGGNGTLLRNCSPQLCSQDHRGRFAASKHLRERGVAFPRASVVSKTSTQSIRLLYSQVGERKQVRKYVDDASDDEDVRHEQYEPFESGLRGGRGKGNKRANSHSESRPRDVEDQSKFRGTYVRKPKKRFQIGGLLKLMVKTHPDESVLPILDEWVDSGIPVLKNALIIALTGLKRAKRFKQALEVTEWIWTERPVEMNELDHLYRLYLTGEVGGIKDVEKCFADIPSKFQTEKVYNQLISCYIARNMMVKAERVLAKLKDSGELISACPYNQLMSHYRCRYQDEKIFNTIKEMKKAGVAPDTSTYNILLSVKHRHGDIDGLSRLFREMKAAGVPPSMLTYSIVGKAYLAAGFTKEAEAVTKEMEKHGSRMTSLSHDLLLSVYAEQGNLIKAERLWKFIDSSSRVSFRSYGVMIESLGKMGDVHKAEGLVDEVERRKGRLSMRVYNALMYVYCRHGLMQEAEALMTQINKKGLNPNAVTYLHLAVGYLKIEQLDKALETLNTSLENLAYDHSKPWFETLMIIMETLAQRGDTERAEQVLQTVTKTGYHRTTQMYNKLLTAYVKAQRIAPTFLQRMGADNLRPDTQTLALLQQMESLVN